jgi:hypothetical protein
MAKRGEEQAMKPHVTFSKINFVEQAEAIERILQAAVRRELLIHKRLGNPIAVGKTARLSWYRLKK